jgi:hypothetical protein
MKMNFMGKHLAMAFLASPILGTSSLHMASPLYWTLYYNVLTKFVSSCLQAIKLKMIWCSSRAGLLKSEVKMRPAVVQNRIAVNILSADRHMALLPWIQLLLVMMSPSTGAPWIVCDLGFQLFSIGKEQGQETLELGPCPIQVSS